MNNTDDGYEKTEDDTAKQVLRGFMYGVTALAATTIVVVNPGLNALKTRHAAEIAAINQELGVMQSQINELHKQIAIIDARIADRAQEIKQKKQRLEKLREELKEFKRQCAEEEDACSQLLSVVDDIQQQIFAIESSSKRQATKLSFNVT